jgi:hypothetical protein
MSSRQSGATRDLKNQKEISPCGRNDKHNNTKLIILDRRITCNRKALQQLVGRSSVSVLPPGMREARLFNILILRQKNKVTSKREQNQACLSYAERE